MVTRNIYEEPTKAGIFNRMLGNLRTRLGAYTPRDTDPMYQGTDAQAARELLLRQYINERERGNFFQDASADDLTALALQFGVMRTMNESDADLRRRQQAAVQSFGFAGTPSAYRAHALNASADVADAVAEPDNTIPRTDVTIVAVRSASDPTATPPLVGVPTTALQAAVQAYLRAPIRAGVGDDNLRVVKAAPTEYRLLINVDPDTPQVISAARDVCYDFIAENAVFGATIVASRLTTRLENEVAGLNFAVIGRLSVAPYPSGAPQTLRATGTTIYSAQLNSTGVAISGV